MKSFYTKIISKKSYIYYMCAFNLLLMSGQFHGREFNQEHVKMFIGLYIFLIECNVLLAFL